MLQLTTVLFLVSFSLLAVIHFLALKLFLYWSLEWLDIPMHLFGGAIVALGFFTLRDLRLIPSSLITPIKALAFVLLVALAWELFEFFTGIAIDEAYYFDTALDIVMGLLGGFIGYFVGNRLHSL